MNNSLYTGLTNNLKKRLLQHNKGEFGFTKNKAPWKLAWFCVFSNKSKAAEFEKYLKTASGIAFRNKRLI